MIGGGLVSVLSGVVSGFEDDLRLRAESDPVVGGVVEGEWVAARDAGRTDVSLAVWREGLLTQVAVGWVLASVFVRFCEDNGLIRVQLLSGPGERRRRAEDGQVVFFREHPAEGERGFVLDVFRRAAELPGLGEVLGPHSPVWLFGPSDDACRDLLSLWREVNPETGVLVWDFTDPGWDTRFLGDLYQDLSESARKSFALLQTPDFVEEFILDRTLDPALDEFGLSEFRVIDPACGSGHFLLGSFERLFERWQVRDPSVGDRALAARALGSVFGVDLNPFAVAIARFRLLVAALKVSGIGTLAEAPVFPINVAAGDALLHGPPPGQQTLTVVDEQDPATEHLFKTEDGDQVRRFLSQKYHAVVANPPYIQPPTKAANRLYRGRYKTCKGKYALTIPFMERLFDLAIRGGPSDPAGFVGQITSNSFMKREFGKKLVEEFLATEIDLTTVIDTAGAYIPGHGTPTVILIGRNRQPISHTVRAVLGIRGEPSRPDNPAHGLVWTSITNNIDQPGAEDRFTSSDDLVRDRLTNHPWSLEGGAAQDLKAHVAAAAESVFGDLADIGIGAIAGEDDAFVLDAASAARFRFDSGVPRHLIRGEDVRDWNGSSSLMAIFPYAEALLGSAELPLTLKRLWPFRTSLWARLTFSNTSYKDEGRTWWEWHQTTLERLDDRPTICFAFVSTHNHFSSTRTDSVFNRSAPVAKIRRSASVDDHLSVLGKANSSVAAFWFRQICQRKNAGAGSTEPYQDRLEFDISKVKTLPIANGTVSSWSRTIHAGADDSRLRSAFDPQGTEPTCGEGDWARSRGLMVSVQEELDWRCYFLYGLTSEDLSLSPEDAPPINKGERAFEIALARRLAAGEVETSWFERHGSTPITELPADWSGKYRALVERRLALIESDRFINLVERPEYKRRWNWDDWEDLEREALEGWLLGRLEGADLWGAGEPRSVNQIADTMRVDDEFMQVAELYARTPDFDVAELIAPLVASDAAPFLAAWRYTDSGLRKRAEWEKTWDLQRREDAGEDVGDIPVPPKYTTKDFRSTDVWKLRGKLDVPKERFMSYPGVNRDVDPSLLVGWAGWDHLQQVTALAAVYEQRRTVDGWDAERLTPVLAGIAELVPWVIQWHNDPDPSTGQRLGDFFADFVTTECATLGIPTTDLTTWTPPQPTRRRSKART